MFPLVGFSPLLPPLLFLFLLSSLWRPRKLRHEKLGLSDSLLSASVSRQSPHRGIRFRVGAHAPNGARAPQLYWLIPDGYFFGFTTVAFAAACSLFSSGPCSLSAVYHTRDAP